MQRSGEQSEGSGAAVLHGERPTRASSGPGRQRQPAAVRKAQIVRAAQRLIGEHGLAGVSMARIAHAVGITDAALYRHFRSREDILIAVHGELTERVFVWLTSAQGPDAISRLREIGEAHSRLLSSDVEYFTAPMFQFNSWICRDGVYEQVVTRRRATRQWFTDLVREGKAKGHIRGDIDTDVAVAEILAWISWEDLSYLQDRNEAMASGISAAVFAGIVERISVHG